MPDADDESRLDDYDEDFDEEDWDDANCHQLPDGTCLAAGSEYCEFECPYRGRRL